jgi:hypothetical protein
MTEISGGARLESSLRELSTKLGRGGAVKVGFLSNATYPDGTSVPLVATVQEFGSPTNNIPPRPFFRNMIAAKSGEWPAAIGGLLTTSNYDVVKTLRLTGEAIAGQLKQSIVDFDSVPLKPATIRAKGFDKQLIDTGHMLASIDSEVIE